MPQRKHQTPHPSLSPGMAGFLARQTDVKEIAARVGPVTLDRLLFAVHWPCPTMGEIRTVLVDIGACEVTVSPDEVQEVHQLLDRGAGDAVGLEVYVLKAG